MLLKHGIAECNELYFFILAAVAVHHAHFRIVTRDEFLQNEVIFVRGTVDGVQNRIKFLAGVCNENLLFVREFAVPICHAVRGLDDDREVERQLKILVVLIRAGCCLREREAMLLADLIKAFLDGKAH